VKPPRRPTITDVARRAGVSPTAVSFAVNGRPGVAEGTRRRILTVAEELGWRPSAHARALMEARARVIGLVLTREPEQLEVDAFFVRFLAGVERALAQSDYALLLQVRALGEEGEALSSYARLAAGARVDGFLLTDIELADPRFALLQELGMPAVVAGHPVGECPFPAVETEHAAGVRAAVEHLVGLGHERVGFVGTDERLEYVQVRRREWERALRATGRAPGPDAFAGPRDRHATAATAALLERPERPTALVFTSDALAMAGLAVARERGLRVPQDLSVTGFDDSPLAALASPPLTSVRVDYRSFGEAAAGLLLADVLGQPAPAWRPGPAELVVRGSTGPAR
jgi:DNA-binding LacI/PurR family transcriptional regulator